MAAAERDAAAGRFFPGLATVPTWVHVIGYDEAVAGVNVQRRWIRDQMRVLNQSFSGRHGQRCRRPSGSDWRASRGRSTPCGRTMEPETEVELEAKTALRQGGPETLNIYF